MRIGKLEQFNIVVRKQRGSEDTKLVKIKGNPIEDGNPFFPRIIIHRPWGNGKPQKTGWTGSLYLYGAELPLRMYPDTKIECMEYILKKLEGLTPTQIENLSTCHNAGPEAIVNEPRSL